MEPLTVTEVSRLVKDTLRCNPDLTDIAVRGEVTGYTERGHHYFSIKDEGSVLKCAIWKSHAGGIDCLPLKDGDKVIVWGSITSWGGNSTYQLDVRKCEPEGRGELYRRFLEMKDRLLKEGLFAPERKKPIPMFPEKVGIVTSEKGAALQDMFRVFMTGPGVEIIVVDARVQGDGAAASIARGIQSLDGKVDLIIIGRGGGSMEDLWAFNEEALARVVFVCKTPIISAVGHEVDEVITDYVSDRRVSTPTAAAELVVQNMARVIEEYRLLGESMRSAIEDNIHNARQVLDGHDMPMWKKIISSRLEMSRKTVEGMSAGLGHSVSSGLARTRENLAIAETKLRTTWIAAIHENGLAALYQNGARVKDAAAFKKGKFEAMLRDGKITGEVKKIEV